MGDVDLARPLVAGGMARWEGERGAAAMVEAGWTEEDREALDRFLRVAPGNGFQLAGIEVRSRAALLGLLDELGAAHPALELQIVDLSHGDDPWGALRRWQEQALAHDRTRVGILVGLEDVGDVMAPAPRLWRALNIQRDLLVRDLPGVWLLALDPQTTPRLETVAPDFCDFVAFWMRAAPASPRPLSPQARLGSEAVSGVEFAVALADLPEPLVAVERQLTRGQFREAEQALDWFELTDSSVVRWRAICGLLRHRLALSRGDGVGAQLALEVAADSAQTAEHQALVQLAFVRISLRAGDLSRAASLLQTPPAPFAWVAFLWRLERKLLEVRRHDPGAVEAVLSELGEARSRGMSFGLWIGAALNAADVLLVSGSPTAVEELFHDVSWPEGVAGLRAEVERLLGHVCWQTGRWVEAEWWLSSARQRLEEVHDVRSSAITQGDLARILLDRGEVTEALRLHEERRRVFEELGDERSRAVVLRDIAHISILRGQVGEALRLYQEALAVFVELGDTRLKSVVLGDIARVLAAVGRLDEAVQMHHERLVALDGFGDLRSRAVTLIDLARIHALRGQNEEAARGYHEAIALFEQLGAAHERAVARVGLAGIHASGGDSNEAIRLYEAAIQEMEQLKDVRGRAAALGQLASVLLDRGQVEAAMQSYQEQLRTFEALGDVEGAASTELGIARVALRRGDRAAALHRLRHAWDTVVDLGRVDGILAIGATLGRLLLAMRDQDGATDVLTRAIEAADKLGRQGEGDALRSLMGGSS